MARYRTLSESKLRVINVVVLYVFSLCELHATLKHLSKLSLLRRGTTLQARIELFSVISINISV